MKRFVFFFLLGLFLPVKFLLAQEDQKLRVAVFDPTSSSVAIDGGTIEAVRELVSSVFVNTGKYTMVERSMLQQIMKEQKMSNTDAFDESQATELGKLAGANKVVLSVVSMVGGRNMLSIKIIDVQTATIDQQKTKIVGTNDLLEAIEPLALELLGEPRTSTQNNKSKKKETQKPQPVNTTIVGTPQRVCIGEEEGICLSFAGYSNSKNPIANIYVDGLLIGTGTLNQGFSVLFSENHVGNYKVKIEWESVISTREFTINTNFKKHFIFEYVKGGFGFEFRLKK